MKHLKAIALLAAAMVVSAPWSSMAEPVPTAGEQPSAMAATLQKLKEAEQADRMSAMSYTSDNPTLDEFYADKADELDALIERIGEGGPVSPQQLQHALSNSDAPNSP